MPFTQQYFDKDFLKALHNEKYRTAGYVARKVGCKLDTAKTALKRLAEAGKVEKLEIDDGGIIAYRKTRKEDLKTLEATLVSDKNEDDQ